MFILLVGVGVVCLFAEGRAGLLFNPAKIEKNHTRATHTQVYIRKISGHHLML